MQYVYTNYSNGWVIEAVPEGKVPCESWMLLPAENLWSVGVRGFLYILAMVYIFLGIAISSDIFMCAIEVITSKSRKVIKWDEERQEKSEKEVLVWNETVANLTLMALGSSAPEILLSVMETCQNLGKDSVDDGLGTFTIIGSAAFNLLMITAICISSVPSPDVKRVQELGVFIMTSAWSIFAYIWLLITLSWVSPGEIEIWEAWVTFAFFPLLVLSAYGQDNRWWLHKCCKTTSVDAMQSQTNVRVIDKRRGSMVQGISKELGALEREKQNNSQVNVRHAEEGKPPNDGTILYDAWNHSSSPQQQDEGSQTRLVHSPSRPNTPSNVSSKNMARARFRFRHAAVRSMLGGRKKPAQNHFIPPHIHKSPFGDDAHAIHGDMKPEDLVGKFTLASSSYSVLESAGIITIDVLFHRRPPGPASKMNGFSKTENGGLVGGVKETSFISQSLGTVTIEYETREGSGKIDKDFKFTSGKLTFAEDEEKKSLSVPIINDNQYEADVDFYVILKNAAGTAGIGDPSVARITIIDDDEPGEFQFSATRFYADIKNGVLTADVTRQKGCDGTVTIEYSTIDGTACGGDKLSDSADYKRQEGVLTFLHNESSKTISININKKCQTSKNFIITLKNPSLGAKIGEHGAAVAYIKKDDLDERIAELMDDNDDEEMTWGGQFRAALTLEDDPDSPLKWYHYLMHFLAFFWKVLLAFIPPKQYGGAWPCFAFSLMAIGGMTAIVEALGGLLGCVLGIKASVAGITIIALGTSLPDTFASRTAALHDAGADAAIGNVTGSNSVNVFLGLGLPWVINVMYNLARNKKFNVATDNLVQSVVLFTICGSICILMLLIRRRVFGGELGGTKVTKYLSSAFLASLWLIYIIISSLQAYYPTMFPWS